MNESLKPKDLQIRYDAEADIYDKKRYLSPKGKYYEQAEAEILRKLCFDKKLVCDIATGTGKNIAALSSQCDFIVGADISFNMLKKARDKCNELRIKNYALIQADANRLPFRGNTFDAVFSTKFFHNIPFKTHKAFFNEMARISNSIVIIELLNKFLWLGLVHLLISLRNIVKGRCSRRAYFPWHYQKITGRHKKISMYGFGVGLPFSDFMLRHFSFMFKGLNYLLTYSFLKYIAAKAFLSIKVERKTE